MRINKMEQRNENIVIIAKMAMLLIFMTFIFVVLQMVESHKLEDKRSKDLYKKHIGKNYIFENKPISIDSNLNIIRQWKTYR